MTFLVIILFGIIVVGLVIAGFILYWMLMAALILLGVVFLFWAYLFSSYFPDTIIILPSAVVATGLTFWAFNGYIDRKKTRGHS